MSSLQQLREARLRALGHGELGANEFHVTDVDDENEYLEEPPFEYRNSDEYTPSDIYIDYRQPDTNSWTCEACTFLNNETMSNCEMCSNSRQYDMFQHRPTESSSGSDSDESVRLPDEARTEQLIGSTSDRWTHDPFMAQTNEHWSEAPFTGNDMHDDSQSMEYHGSSSSSSSSSAWPSDDPFYDGVLRHIAGGALVGGVIGGISAAQNRRSIGSGAVDGAVAGAMGGALLGAMQQAQNRLGTDYQDQVDEDHLEAQRQQALIYSMLSDDAMMPRSQLPHVPQRRQRQRQHRHVQDLITMLRLGDHVGMSQGEDEMDLFGLLQDEPLRNQAASEDTIARYSERKVCKADEKDSCAVCMEKMTVGEMGKNLSCAHFFHSACIDQWLRTSARCPICNRAVE